MPLSSGTKLGPYEILAPLGAGGMGEVYRARDARLNRDVALKILPAAFAADADRVARFRREAQVLASLSHPNIGHIYGFEDTHSTGSGGDVQLALVLELIEGPTLADCLETGPLPLAETLRIAGQIAGAMEAAHEHGIVHRDLKPANIKVPAEGPVKVLDFGLAKALDPTASSNADAMNSPTLSARATQLGVILGTAAYMAPEQAKGKPIDRRADIWAFGVVLYEMLSGQRAFKGDDVTDTLASVLRQDVDFTALPASTPASLRRLIARCLDRDVKRRLRDIGEARIVLEEVASGATSVAVGNPESEVSTTTVFRRWLPWAVAAIVFMAGAVGWWRWWQAPASSAGTVTRSVMQRAAAPTQIFEPALSRDGTRLVYGEIARTGSGAQPHLSLRMMDQLEGKLIPGTEGGFGPVFSPDGQWIAFTVGPRPYKFKKIPVTGGAAVTLCDMPDGSGAAWGTDETIVFGSSKGLMRVPAAGGTPENVTTVNDAAGEARHVDPQFLPGGRAMLFAIRSKGTEASAVAVVDLNTRTYRVLQNGRAPRYAASGHLVYLREETLFAVPFDLKRLAVAGTEGPVAEGVDDGGGYTVSDAGLLVFLAGGGVGLGPNMNTLEFTDRKGVANPLPEPPRPWWTMAVSPDGKSLAGAIYDTRASPDARRADVWKYDFERSTLQRLTFEGSNAYPVWTHDGRFVTFNSRRDDKFYIYRVPSDASGPPELVLTGDPGTQVAPLSWTPDGKTLLYRVSDPKVDRGANHTWILPPAGTADSKPRRLLQTPFADDFAQISPDGKWVLYSSAESGRLEVYAAPFPGPGAKFPISTQGGRRPRWSRTGRELYYAENTAPYQVMAVDVQTTPVFKAGTPKAIFKRTSSGAEWDPTPDPQRFLVERVQDRPATATAQFIMITNWFDDLRRRAPAKR